MEINGSKIVLTADRAGGKVLLTLTAEPPFKIMAKRPELDGNGLPTGLEVDAVDGEVSTLSTEIELTEDGKLPDGWQDQVRTLETEFVGYDADELDLVSEAEKLLA